MLTIFRYASGLPMLFINWKFILICMYILSYPTFLLINYVYNNVIIICLVGNCRATVHWCRWAPTSVPPECLYWKDAELCHLLFANKCCSLQSLLYSVNCELIGYLNGDIRNIDHVLQNSVIVFL